MTDGKNLFANGTFEGTPLLKSAIAGCLKTIPDLTLIFAPHDNSYDRLVPESHAPTGICWAYDNRTASIRVPGGSHVRAACRTPRRRGRCEPLSVLAAVLGSALIGIEDDMQPPPPISGNAYDQDLAQIPDTWEAAIDTFEDSPIVKRIFPQLLIDNLVATKRQELHYFAEMSPQQRIDLLPRHGLRAGAVAHKDLID